MNHRFWGTTAILLGAWESIAFGTRWIPTISATIWTLQERCPIPTRVVVILWAAGLVKHLLVPAVTK